MTTERVDDLEVLLQNEIDSAPAIVDKIEAPPAKAPLRSDGGCDLTDFITMVAEIVEKTLKKTYNVEFVPDEGAIPVVDASEDLTSPKICFSVVLREPKKENKPRVRDEFWENTVDGSKRYVTIWGQKFRCEIQFDIYASEYTTANAVMIAFESMMANYTAYFKQKGLAELYFLKHFTDKNYSVFRNKISVRNLCYYAEVERLTPVFDGEILDIV